MYLVFDVGATFIKYALMDDEGNISGKGKTPTDRYAEAGTPAFVAQIKKVSLAYRATIASSIRCLRADQEGV